MCHKVMEIFRENSAFINQIIYKEKLEIEKLKN